MIVMAYLVGLILGAMVGLLMAALCRAAATYSDFDEDEVKEAENKEEETVKVVEKTGEYPFGAYKGCPVYVVIADLLGSSTKWDIYESEVTWISDVGYSTEEDGPNGWIEKYEDVGKYAEGRWYIDFFDKEEAKKCMRQLNALEEK